MLSEAGSANDLLVTSPQTRVDDSQTLPLPHSESATPPAELELENSEANCNQGLRCGADAANHGPVRGGAPLSAVTLLVLERQRGGWHRHYASWTICGVICSHCGCHITAAPSLPPTPPTLRSHEASWSTHTHVAPFSFLSKAPFTLK